MGGCRCTYRNCKVKSDGKTHMFHYPVFEKVRCHQWLINAHRLDFLDLKVSQLKNRVVCQHHFKDENFMNFKKDKLTFDAIPTEDGPYCDTVNYVDTSLDSSKMCSIIVDDLENEYLNESEKKASFSTKYGDFLTNLVFMDTEKSITELNTTCKPDSSLDILPLYEENDKDKFINEDGSFFFKLSEASDKKGFQRTLAVPPYLNSSNKLNQNYDKINQNGIPLKSNLNSIQLSSEGKEIMKHEKPQQKEIKKKPKITIISEKKITNPVPITGKFEPVFPNFVLNISKTKRDIKENSPNTYTKNVTELQELQPEEDKNKVEIEIDPADIKEEEQPTSSTNTIQNKIVFEKPSRISLLKSKVTPERVEAINKKRKFNMKLREVIESCLDKLESPNKTIESVSPEENNEFKRSFKSPRNVTRESPALNNQEYTIAFLEARMRKMENNLLEKIEQNSKKIGDLKNTYLKDAIEKKATAQTRCDEEAHKKQLFQEISKYLSPSSKSLVYEELFINKFSLNEPNVSAKRKRGRCFT